MNDSKTALATFREAPLEIIDGDRGVNYPKQNDFREAGHCLFLNAGNVTSTGFNFKDVAFISKEKDSELRKGKLKREDIVLTTRGTVGNVAYYNNAIPYNDIRINSGMVVIRTDPEKLRPRFLYAYLRSPSFKDQVSGLVTGSAQPQLPIRDIMRIILPVPGVKIQDRIADVVSSLDDKIELNRKMNETLEAMARAIFKSWFIDFDPVYAKAAGRKPFGMAAATAALFPDSFEESELGEIPRGWKIERAGSLFEIYRTSVNPGSSPEEIFDHYSLPAFDEGRVPKTELGSQIKSSKFLVEPKDVLISKLNPATPRIWLLPSNLSEKSVCSTEFMVVRPSRIGTAFLTCLLQSQPVQEKLVQTATGTSNSHQRTKPEVLLGVNVALPPQNLLVSFETSGLPLLELSLGNLKESQGLAQARELLLPRLLSGALKVKEAS